MDIFLSHDCFHISGRIGSNGVSTTISPGKNPQELKQECDDGARLCRLWQAAGAAEIAYAAGTPLGHSSSANLRADFELADNFRLCRGAVNMNDYGSRSIDDRKVFKNRKIILNWPDR